MAIQLALVSDNTSAKKIADEVMAELEKEDLYTEDEVYSQDVIAMMYEMYHNFDPDVKWLEKALHVREKMNIILTLPIHTGKWEIMKLQNGFFAQVLSMQKQHLHRYICWIVW